MARWTKLKIGTDLFVGKFDRNSTETGESFTFWLSDFKTLWSECIDGKDNLLRRFSNDNPTLEINGELFDRLLIAFVGSTAQTSTNIKPGDEEVKLQLNLFIGEETSSQFHWLLQKSEPQMFFDQVTKSLLHQIVELQDDKQQLMDIVKKKDDEIKQHKLEGARELERKRFITEVFNANEFTSQPQTFDCVIDDYEIVVGPVSKKHKTDEVQKVEVSPKKPTAKNHMRRQPQKLVKLGLNSYESDDDDDAGIVPIQTEELVLTVQNEEQVKIEQQVKTEVAECAPKVPSPKKRLRREFKL